MHLQCECNILILMVQKLNILHQKQQIEYSHQQPQAVQVNVAVKHVLSVEIEDFKREFIKAAHTAPGQAHEFCLFDDVGIFAKDQAFCYTCNQIHSTSMNVDVYFVGPSCKNVSTENNKRAIYANDYVDGQGCSGETYSLGFKKGIQMTCPAIAFFENTKGVADYVKDSEGKKQRPRIEVGLFKQ